MGFTPLAAERLSLTDRLLTSLMGGGGVLLSVGVVVVVVVVAVVSTLIVLRAGHVKSAIGFGRPCC